MDKQENLHCTRCIRRTGPFGNSRPRSLCSQNNETGLQEMELVRQAFVSRVAQGTMQAAAPFDVHPSLEVYHTKGGEQDGREDAGEKAKNMKKTKKQPRFPRYIQ